MNITEKQLLQLGKEIMLRYWGMELEIPIVINSRLKRTYGRFIYRYVRDNHTRKVIAHKPLRIEIGSHSLEKLTFEQIVDLLKHEICHYACCKKGKPHSDGSAYFESELLRVGASSTRTDFDLEKSEQIQRNAMNKRKEKSKYKYKKYGNSKYEVYYNGEKIGQVEKILWANLWTFKNDMVQSKENIGYKSRHYAVEAMIKKTEEYKKELTNA